MLKSSKNVRISGYSVINNKQVASFVVNIPEEEPERMTFDPRQLDPELYWKNLSEVMADQTAFLEKAVEVQQQMIAEKA